MSSVGTPYTLFDDMALLGAGLNLHAVLAVDSLPPELQARLQQAGADSQRFPSLVLIGNGGPGFWRAFEDSQTAGPHPVDAFSRQVITGFMERRFAGTGFQFLYPGLSAVPLQTLGQLVGWHHDSPMNVGINDTWGLWFAYRALVAVAAELVPSAPVPSRPPCLTCEDKPCITVCPAQALQQSELRLERCVDFRLQENSVCSHQCLARRACPVAAEQRYDAAQVHYHYGHSLPHLLAWRDRKKLSN